MTYNLGNGQFEYVTDVATKMALANGHQAISATNSWEYMKLHVDPNNKFNFDFDNKTMEIAQKMEELGYDGHSAASFGFVMSTLHFIAVNGEQAYIDKFF
jgi:hypothetical protein